MRETYLLVRGLHDSPNVWGISAPQQRRIVTLFEWATMADTLKGRRLLGRFLRLGAFRPGDYQIVTAGSENAIGLWVLPPGHGSPKCVAGRRYIEHRDGTVSIEGILEIDGWRGSLLHGVWRET